MSYCRFSVCDQYIVSAETLNCMGCRLNKERKCFSTNSRQMMLEHIADHAKAGHIVSQRAINRLKHEIITIGDIH